MSLRQPDFAEVAGAVAARAATLIEPGMRLGLGSGRMANAFLEALRPRVGSGLQIQGLCTSLATERLAQEVGIELLPGSGGELDLDVDGADEFDASLNLLKGGGGALLREKVVAQRSRRFWVLADSSKQVAALASRRPLPVEVLQYDWQGTAQLLGRRLGCQALPRRQEGEMFRSDNGNYILDLAFADGISDPTALAAQLAEIAGVLGHGLFLGLATAALVYADGEVRCLGDLGRGRARG